MVLINNLTVDEINAALLHLQRSQNEVVGGEKGTTIQNITITNTGGGSGNSGGTVSQDWSPIIDALESRINAAEKATLELDKKAAENEQIDSAQTEQISSILEQLMSLSSNGITSLQFDATNRYLIIYTEDGNTYDVQITSEPITMTFDSTTNKLTLVMGSQTQEVTLPYINANQKGVAGGVATLDESGRVPYSQLPESAMEFKGEWNASTNTPTLADGTGTNGDFYVCNVGGTVNFGTQAEPREVTFVPNDRVIYNGDTDLWVKLPAGQVISVNGQSGVVELTGEDIPYDSNAQSPSVKDMLDDLEPVDNVTVGEMSAVTSNAVAQAIGSIIYDPNIIDCDNAYEVGKTVTYVISELAAHVPNSDNGWFIISQCNPESWDTNSYVTQIATPSKNVGVNTVSIYIRHAYYTGSYLSWTSWVECFTKNSLANNIIQPGSSQKPVSQEAVADALAKYGNEHVVGTWRGRTMYEVTEYISVPTYTGASLLISWSTPNNIFVVDFGGIYIKGTESNPSFVMHLPYFFIDSATGKWLNTYIYWNPPGNNFQISLGGTFQNGYFSTGIIYFTYRYYYKS